ncbi:MAG: hypothetical protein HQ546_02815, partial [Planctomycetes bacterium]|nr:hypothetical protein [Planctomycetota bacterium]
MSKSVSEIALQTKDKPFPGWFEGVAMAVCTGGFFSDTQPELSPGPEGAKAVAAEIMNKSRSWGGRIHQPPDHYGAMRQIIALRCIMSAGVLSPEEFNEAENWLTLSAAHPNEYFYNHIGGGDGRMNVDGGRHFCACLLITVNLLDYVREHCRMDEATAKEIERRYEGARKTLAAYSNSFRDNGDTVELGESTMMLFYAMLHQGMMDAVGNGNLARMADIYAMTTDNILGPGRNRGAYAGLDSYISAAPGCLRNSWHGRGLLAAAAWYYDNPQFRWFVKQVGSGAGHWGSVACPMMLMHYDVSGPIEVPDRYDGAAAIPFDPRLYEMVADSQPGARWGRRYPVRLPGPLEKSVDRVAFRDGMDPDDAYMFLATNQRIGDWVPFQNNAIARYTDLGDVWLFQNTMNNTTWARNVVSISNGKPYVPAAGCTLEALANLGQFSVAASKESGIAGADWTRTIVHWRDHYFLIMDKVQALENDEF